MAPIRIMLADSNRAYVSSMQETLQRESDLDVVATSNNGSEALKAALCAQPDVLITDLVMPVLDGFALMESLSKARLDVRIIVLTELTRDCFIRQAMALGANYYMVKPVDPSILIRRVRDSLSFSQAAPPTPNTREPGDAISDQLSALGVTPGSTDYRYLHFAVGLASRMEKLSGHITTEIYPSIARTFQTDQRNVERAIRHAIQSAWASDSAPPGEKPTNGELIARLAKEYLARRAPF